MLIVIFAPVLGEPAIPPSATEEVSKYNYNVCTNAVLIDQNVYHDLESCINFGFSTFRVYFTIFKSKQYDRFAKKTFSRQNNFLSYFFLQFSHIFHIFPYNHII